MNLQSLLSFAVKMDEAAHGVKQSSGDRKPQPQSACKTAASGICLIKIIAHLGKLGICHTNPGIINVYEKIYSVTFRAESDTDINATLFCELNGIFRQDLQDMGNFFCVSDQDSRYFWINIKHDFQLVPVVLHGSHGNDIIQYGCDHIRFPGRSQSTFHDFRIVQHIVDLIGKTFTSLLYGTNTLSYFR